jgi:2-amino-4-hydroxy-6-hydroxymethyldihydropteridine diphosphokinase
MPRQLLRVVREIERRLGRRRLVRGGPRVLDIDILFYGRAVVRARELEIPHPRLAERRFVLIPLREIAPALRHPVLGKTIAELLADLRDRSRVRKYRG